MIRPTKHARLIAQPTPETRDKHAKTRGPIPGIRQRKTRGNARLPRTSRGAMTAFVKNLQAELIVRNMTISELAGRTGLAREFLSRVIHGHQDLTIPRAELVAQAVGRPLADLLAGGH